MDSEIFEENVERSIDRDFDSGMGMVPPEAPPSIPHLLLGNISVPAQDLEDFYEFVSEIVASSNLNATDTALLMTYREEFENDFYMSIPSRYQRYSYHEMPDKYLKSALKDISVQETVRKIVNLLQISKGREGFFVKQLTRQEKIYRGEFEDRAKKSRWPFGRGK